GLHGVHMCCQQTSQHGITARKLAEWLNHPLTPKASYGFVTSTITSAASGWNDRVAGWGCNSETGCRFVERILTVVQTRRLQGKNVLEYLHRAVQAYRNGLSCPALLTQ